jgi:hypothetical protein
VDKGFQTPYAFAFQTMQEVPYALRWASTVYQSAPMQRVRCRYIAIYH